MTIYWFLKIVIKYFDKIFPNSTFSGIETRIENEDVPNPETKTEKPGKGSVEKEEKKRRSRG